LAKARIKGEIRAAFFLSYEISLYQQIYPSSPVTAAILSSLTLLSCYIHMP